MLYSHVTLLMLRVVDVVTKTTVQNSARMQVAEIPGDIQIGVLLPIHKSITGMESCGEIWEQYGIHRTEIALKTIKEINEELPFRLGMSIRDSCWTDRIGMEQTIAFLREGVAQCSCCQTPGCNKKSAPVVAVVGPGKSSATIAVQNLLQVFRIPQIGYSATAPDLSDKEQFGYFMRVVPSDMWQAKAIHSLLEYYKFSYIAVVYSSGAYGEKGFESLERHVSKNTSKVCIAFQAKIKALAAPAEYRQVLRSLSSLKQRPQVVVCFCDGESMKSFFKAQRELAKQMKQFQRFQWIGSDGWADRSDVVEGLEDEAAGGFSIRIHAPKIPGFRKYFTSLHPENNTLNPWFKEFWEFKFKCQFAVSKEDKNNEKIKICTGNEDLEMDFKEDPKLSQVINSIKVVAYGLKAMYQDRCRDNSTLCSDMLARNGTLLYHYLMNVTFRDQFDQAIYFDRNGDPPAWFDILNYVGYANTDQPYVEIGAFRSVNEQGKEELNMTDISNVMFYSKTSELPTSVCSLPCGVGERQRDTVSCCWHCDKCLDNQIVTADGKNCTNCSLGWWPDSQRTGCVKLPEETIDWTRIGPVIALCFASLGIITTAFTILIFLRHNSTPVVKSTTRELSYIILCGIIFCYAITFSVLAKPNGFTCFVSRVVPPIAFSVVYSALLTKTNRIARILAGSKKRILTKKPRFLSTFSQVIITWILVGVQCVIVAACVMKEWPDATFVSAFLPRRMVLECNAETTAFLIPFFWDFFLISLCTLYAFKTRNLPENFNEAKFIGFTMYCTVVVWIAFLVLHMGTSYKALVMSFSCSISASVALVLLFFPKLYIILLHPERNVRASYTTTKLIRCHFGNSQGTYDSTKQSQHLSSRTATRTSVQSGSVSKSSSTGGTTGINRNASVHVPIRHSHSDATTQTDGGSRLARAFSITRHRGSKGIQLDEDSMKLYEEEKIQATTGNLLLEEAEDEVGALLADSIENSVRTVLSTVAGGHAARPQRLPQSVIRAPSASNHTAVAKTHPRVVAINDQPSVGGVTDDSDGFEQLLRSGGIEPLTFTQATPL